MGEAKNECDKVIDKNGTPKTGGNGIKQLRENIADSKLSYEIKLKGGKEAKNECDKVIDKNGTPKTFAAFMEEHADLRGLIDTGKGDLQWERDIPPAALANLEKLASGDFKGNLGKIIHDIYQTAHIMFSDMPQGDHKKRAKYRFASKTLTLDLYEILGQCTWGQPQ